MTKMTKDRFIFEQAEKDFLRADTGKVWPFCFKPQFATFSLLLAAFYLKLTFL